jgi:hypothetical protein
MNEQHCVKTDFSSCEKSLFYEIPKSDAIYPETMRNLGLFFEI